MRQTTTKGSRLQYSVYLTEHELKLIKNLEARLRISAVLVVS